MLDVHPAQHAASTWRDFLIHIATIVIGLLVALGLEQTVVLIEHHHEVKELRERLAKERENNIDIFHKNVSVMRDMLAMLRGDERVLMYLKVHPDSSVDQLPGVLSWSRGYRNRGYYVVQTASWDWAEKAPVLELMPQTEVTNDRHFYTMLNDLATRQLVIWDCMDEAGDYRFTQPDITKLTPQQIDRALERTQTCLEKTHSYALLLYAVALVDPGFMPGPTGKELDSFDLTGGSNFDAIGNPSHPSPLAAAMNAKDLASAHVWDKDEAVVVEFIKALRDNDFSDARRVYDEFCKTHPGFKPDEAMMNKMGYAEITHGDPVKSQIPNEDLDKAISIFELNVRLYPESWNAYDSLGEAYRYAGKKQLSIANYEKSLQLNPGNANAVEMLKELKQ